MVGGNLGEGATGKKGGEGGGRGGGGKEEGGAKRKERTAVRVDLEENGSNNESHVYSHGDKEMIPKQKRHAWFCTLKFTVIIVFLPPALLPLSLLHLLLSPSRHPPFPPPSATAALSLPLVVTAAAAAVAAAAFCAPSKPPSVHSPPGCTSSTHLVSNFL